MPAFEGFEKHQLEQLLKLASDAARRAGIKDPQIDANALETELGEILIWTGLCNEDSEGGRLWAELTNNGPSHRSMRDAAAAAAIADSPLDPGVLAKDLRPRLGALIIARWSPRWRRESRGETPRLRDLVWSDLNETEQREIRDMIRHLADYSASHVHRGNQQKNDLDTALFQIGEMFVALTGQQISAEDLPSNEESHFIRFASIALYPIGQDQSTGPEALARRWARHKKHSATGDPDN